MTAPVSQPAAAAGVKDMLVQKIAILASCPTFFLQALQQQAEQGEIAHADLVWMACAVLLGRAA